MFNQSGLSSKFLNNMFRKIDGLVWDLQSGSLGIKGTEGIYTLTSDYDLGSPAVPASENNSAIAAVPASTSYGVSVNPFDSFGISIPAFATKVPFSGINIGDLVVGEKDILGWVTSKAGVSLKLLDKNGFNKTYSPPKLQIMNQDGALIVQSLGGMFGGQAGVGSLQQSLLPMLMLSGGDTDGLDSILPLMLFGQMQQTNPNGAKAIATEAGNPSLAANPLSSLMPMLMMQSLAKKKKSSGGKSGGLGSIDPMMLMMMSGGFGGAQQGSINPLMLLAMGGLGGDDTDDAVSLPITGAGTDSFIPALQRLKKN